MLSALETGCAPDSLDADPVAPPTKQVTQALATTSTTCACVGDDPVCTCVDTSSTGFSFAPNSTASELDKLLAPVKQVLGVIGTVSSVINYAEIVAKFLGLLTDDTGQTWIALENKLDTATSAITYKIDQSDRKAWTDLFQGQLTKIQNDANNNNGAVFENNAYWDMYDGQFDGAIIGAQDITSFERYYVDSQTNGASVAPTFNGAPYSNWQWTWKNVISYSQSDLAAPIPSGDASHGFVYDWRYALPTLLQLDALRMLFMITEDVSQGFDFKHAKRNQVPLRGMRGALQMHLDILTNGIRCNTKPLTLKLPGSYCGTYELGAPICELSGHYVSCADIYSGINSTIFVDCHGSDLCPDAAQAAKQQAYNDVRKATPWFQTQSMIDTLYSYEQGLNQLTDVNPLIRTEENRDLCLDADDSVMTVSLSSCSSAQAWRYSADEHKISATGTDFCLDAGGANRGTPARLALCNGGLSQQWSYDPQHHVLNNALGNALDVAVATPHIGQTVVTNISADLNGLAQDFQVYESADYPPQRWNQEPIYALSQFGHVKTLPQLVCTNCAVRWGAMATGHDGVLYTRALQSAVYTGPTAITSANFAPSGAAIAAVLRSTTETDAFLVANDGEVYATAQVNGGAWQAPVALTAANFAPPGAPLDSAMINGQAAVAVVDNSGRLQVTLSQSPSGWQAPVAITGPGYAPPGAAVTFGKRANGEVDVFTIGTDGTLKYMFYNLGAWGGPLSLSASNFAPPGAPVATAVDVHGFLNVFTVGNDGAVYTKWDCTPLWCGATPISATGFAPTNAKLAALNYNNGALDVFVVPQSGAINMFSNAGTSWTGPTPISPVDLAPPGADLGAMPNSSELDVFAVSNEGQLVELINAGSGWSEPNPFE